MLKPNIQLIRDGERQVLLTWHKLDGQGGHIPLAIEYTDAVEPEMRQRIEDLCRRPLNARENGQLSTALPGSSKHFLALPKVLERLGFRVHAF